MNALETGLYNKLNIAAVTNLATGGIWDTQAPQGTTTELVIFQHAGGGHENLSPSELINVVYLVKGVSETGAAAAGNIDAQIKAALHGQTLTVSGYTNIITMREDEFQLMETLPDGRKVYHRGAYYRIRLDT